MPTVSYTERKRRLAIKTTFHNPDFLACFPACALWLRLGYKFSCVNRFERSPPPPTPLLCLSFQFPYNSGWSVDPFVLWGRHCKPFANGTMRFILAALATNKRQLSTQRQTVAAQSAYTPLPLHPCTLGQAATCTLQRRGEHVEWALWFAAFCWSLLKKRMENAIAYFAWPHCTIYPVFFDRGRGVGGAALKW